MHPKRDPPLAYQVDSTQSRLITLLLNVSFTYKSTVQYSKRAKTAKNPAASTFDRAKKSVLPIFPLFPAEKHTQTTVLTFALSKFDRANISARYYASLFPCA